MQLYLISQNENNRFDTHDSIVVVAKSAKDARTILPLPTDTWEKCARGYGSWCKSPDKVTVEHLGVASAKLKRGVVLASFNAG